MIRRFDSTSTNVSVTDVTGLGTPASAVRFNSIMQLQRPGLGSLHQGNVLHRPSEFARRRRSLAWLDFQLQHADLRPKRHPLHDAARGNAAAILGRPARASCSMAMANIFCCSGKWGQRWPWRPVVASPVAITERVFWGLRFRFHGHPALPAGFACLGISCKHPRKESLNDSNDDDFGAGLTGLASGSKSGWPAGRMGGFFPHRSDQLDKGELQGCRTAGIQGLLQRRNAGSRRGCCAESARITRTRHIHGSPVVWDDDHGMVARVCFGGENDVLRVYQYTPEINGDPTTRPALYNRASHFEFGEVPPKVVSNSPRRADLRVPMSRLIERGMPGGFLATHGQQPTNRLGDSLGRAIRHMENANNSNVMGTIAAL